MQARRGKHLWWLARVLVYHWIRLDKLYKLMDFFSNFEVIFRINYNFLK